MIQRRGSTLDSNQNDIKKHLLRAVYYNLPKFIKAFKIPQKKKKKKRKDVLLKRAVYQSTFQVT